MSTTGHVRRRGDSWEIKYDLGADPVTGKRVTKFKTIHGPKRAAQIALREILAALDKGQHADAGNRTVGAWLAEWLEEARHNVAPKTWERYAEITIKHLIPALGAIPLAKLGAAHIQSYYTLALASGRRDSKGGLSPQTVRHHDRVLNVAFNPSSTVRAGERA